MTNNEILYKTLNHINIKKSRPDIVSGEYIKALVELGLIIDSWDSYLTKDGSQLLNLLRSVYERY